MQWSHLCTSEHRTWLTLFSPYAEGWHSILGVILDVESGDHWVVWVRCIAADLSSLVWCHCPFASSTARGWILCGLPELVTWRNGTQMYVRVVQTARTQMWPVSAYVPGPASSQRGGGRGPLILASRPGFFLCTQVPTAFSALSGLWEPRDIWVHMPIPGLSGSLLHLLFSGAVVDWRGSSPVWSQAIISIKFCTQNKPRGLTEF